MFIAAIEAFSQIKVITLTYVASPSTSARSHHTLSSYCGSLFVISACFLKYQTLIALVRRKNILSLPCKEKSHLVFEYSMPVYNGVPVDLTIIYFFKKLLE